MVTDKARLYQNRRDIRRTQDTKACMLRATLMQRSNALQLAQYVSGDIIPDALRMTEL